MVHLATISLDDTNGQKWTVKEDVKEDGHFDSTPINLKSGRSSESKFDGLIWSMTVQLGSKDHPVSSKDRPALLKTVHIKDSPPKRPFLFFGLLPSTLTLA